MDQDLSIERLSHLADQIESRLVCNVDEDGFLVDPAAGRIADEQYGEAFLAFSLALKSASGKKPPPDGQIACLLKTVERSYGESPSYHYDFVNLALVLIAELYLREGWSPTPVTEITESLLKRLSHSGVRAANWRAMRLLVAKARGQRLREAWESLALSMKTDSSGWVHDFRAASFPIQYSVYSASLFELGRAWFGLPDRLGRTVSVVYDRTRQIFEWPSGFNTQGRGYQQIFGYGPWVYLACRRHDWQVLHAAIDRLQLHTVSGGIRLVLSESGDSIGCYDYHYQSVYQAFLVAWLRLALYSLRAPWVEASGPHVALRANGWRVGISQGGTKYAAEAALTPHAIFFKNTLLFEGVSGPDGGRHSQKRGNPNMRFLTCAPVLLDPSDSAIPLLSRHNSLRVEGDRMIAEFSGLGIKIRREISVASDLIFHDHIEAKKTIRIRTVNFTLSEEASKQFKVSSSAGELDCQWRESISGRAKVYYHQETLQPSQSVDILTRISKR